MNRDYSVIFETVSRYCIVESFVDSDGYSISSKGFLPTVVDIMVIRVKFTHSCPFTSLILKMSMFTLAISCLITANLPIHAPNILGSYAILFFTSLDFTSITSHIHSWVLFLLWLRIFILSGVISPLISSIILGAYSCGEFIFQCHIFLPFHTVHEVLKARILKRFVIPCSSGLCFVRTLHRGLSVLGGPTQHGS